MKRIKIAFLIPSLDLGGAEKYILKIIKKYEGRKADFYVCYWSGQDILKKEFETLGAHLFRFEFKKLKTLNTFFTLRKFLIDNKIDLIHSNLPDSDYLSFFSAFFTGIGRISTVHSPLIFYENKKIRFNYFIKSFFFDKFICVSEEIFYLLRKKCMIAENKLIMIPNFSDFPEVYPHVKKINEKIVFKSVGRLHPIKNYDFLIDLFSLFSEKYFDKFELHIIGEGEERKKIERKIKEKRMENKIFLRGMSLNPKEEMSNCDFYISSSKSEGLPTSVIEAVSCGVPCILSDISSHRQIIEDGISGTLFDLKDLETACEKIFNFVKNKDLYLKMSHKAFEVGYKKFSSNFIFPRINRIYKEILSFKKRIPSVLYVVDNLGSGGLERMFYLFSKRFFMENIRLRILCLNKGGYYFEKLIENGIDCRLLSVNNIKNPFHLFKLWKEFFYFSPDIIHSHSPYSNGFSVAACFFYPFVRKKIAKIPTIYPDFSRRDFIREKIFSFFTDKYLAVSMFCADWFSKKVKIDRKKISVIYNGGLGLEGWRNSDKKNKEKFAADFIFSTLARLEKLKGVDDILKAFSYYSDKNWIFLIGGDGSHRKELEEISNSLGLKSKVIFYGWVEEPGDILHLSDAFILNSKQREGFSSALSEAAGFGLPLIASDVGGNKEIVFDGVNGILYPEGDVKAIGNAISFLASNKEKRETMGENSLKFFKEKFSFEKSFTDIKKVYEV
ncbi:MAG: glycosyltransferase [Elusimicrobia bacterium]|nr:glycosyltransferase [Elusimicrobiota bacterium]